MIAEVTKSIVRREFKSYFASPLGYVFLIIFLFAIGYVTFEPGSGSFFLMRQADLSSFFRYVPYLFLFLVPAVSMRLLAEERKSGTIELLLTMPVTEAQVVFGKFLAAWLFVAVALAGTFPLVLTVIYLGSPDLGVVILGYLGAALLAGAFLAIGIFFSAISKNQVVSFILGVVFCYVLLMAGSPPILGFISTFLPKFLVEIFESLSIMNHFESMGRGVIVIGDLFFFALMIGGWLYGTILLITEKKSN
ncbi:MAG: ABC transporter permease [Bdellovibrionales bacterium RIFOXYD12_FULL_39_22]|nr:MAG: ABC transporter permease [Bdellovibrionales bacterium RIFOXYB1_FULL_39_21]OFZ41208.1 MAG: ABC transporter permease [Bdellovibrionales bacterium RIFOXYC12_FULL_39_17]OFZ44962.1 MAG: ABC transporter permease [Bdellovibrionales bacterium RIFOXYC1_FULL_39_130]OFZ74409.1 MAG: ABC transporter permease [Bdellovibrionales bacterium RIFOXYD1_FULL_39_84]OFZ74730.1 MAG: ABC transporter permease [Bdellovibrionales bacterium RIFOXYC2_FULL_39_8]OFZ92411.1 MAG: ABC transporter permease [Bdellovibrion